MKIMQGNLNRSRTATDLLEQLRREKNVDILILSEQHRDKDEEGWYSDNLGTAAIYVPERGRCPIDDHGVGTGYVWVRSRGITYVSCYFTPNELIADFQKKLNEMEDTLLDIGGAVVVAGDFNAKAPEWGMQRPDSRGKRILEMTARLDLVVINIGNTSTFRRPGYSETIPDVTFASTDVAARIADWTVIEDYTGSDHQYITFEVLRDRTPTHRPDICRLPRWNYEKMDKSRFTAELRRGIDSINNQHQHLEGQEAAETRVHETMLLIQRACNASMPRKRSPRNRQPVYWWTQEIAELRSNCLRLRRRAQRARGRPEATLRSAEHLAAKKTLRAAIKESKKEKWWSMIDDVDQDPWGLGYKIVTKKLGTLSSPTMDAVTMNGIVDALFPDHPERARTAKDTIDTQDVPLFTKEELLRATNSLKCRKAPGLDGISTEILKFTAQTCPNLLLDMYNCCLMSGVFSARWKEARLVLIRKPKGNVNTASSFRPLCMLDTAGKLLEKLLQPRILSEIRKAGDLTENQHGFRKGHSTLNAVQKVVQTAENAQNGNPRSRRVTLLVTLDVKNAFNSMSWHEALGALREKFLLSGYLMRMMESYLSDRTIRYTTDEGQRTKRLSAGAAQGSIMGPMLWNAAYDSLLRMEMPEGATLVGYADDVAVLITERTVETAQLTLNIAMRKVSQWMTENRLSIATPKTEITLLTRKRIDTILPIQIGETHIKTSPCLKYLGVTLDTKLTFWPHIQRVTEKASQMTTALSRLMANVRGPRPAKRRLLMAVTHSVLLYGSEVWAQALRIKSYRRRISAVQRRGALRVASAYRTVSEPATLVIASVIPIDLLAFERQEIWNDRESQDRALRKRQARQKTLERWQERWSTDTRGRWTARLIPQVENWVRRRHGEVSYYLTQFLSGHGYFNKYLHKMAKVNDPSCIYCEAVDDAHHTFFECPHWERRRAQVAIALGEFLPDSVVGRMLQDQTSWDTVSHYVESLLREKRRDMEHLQHQSA